MTLRRDGRHPDELLSASLSGELTADEQRQLREHLAGCDTCRTTLADFAAQRGMLRRARSVPVPRDLKARVDAGIEAGRFAPGSWWRQPRWLLGGGAVLGTMAAAILAVVVIGNLRLPQGVANASESPSVPASASAPASTIASPVASATSAPSAEPSPVITLAYGHLGMLILDGTPGRVSQMNFVDVTGAHSIQVESAGGTPTSAKLSPNGKYLAYVASLGLSGAQEVRVIDLGDGSTTHLGCSLAGPFTDRLSWSPSGRYLAYTVVGVALGSEQQICEPSEQAPGTVDAWVYDTRTEAARAVTSTGDGFAAGFRPDGLISTPTLIVSRAGRTPASAEIVIGGPDLAPDWVDDVFMPLLSPDASSALFWRGRMDQLDDGTWLFVQGGLPYVSDPAADGGWQLAPDGQALFRDLVPVGGDGFQYGSISWGPDGTWVAFWNGLWTGIPQGPNGDYPDQAAAYVGRAADGLSIDSRIVVGDSASRVQDVTFDAEGQAVLVMVAQSLAGELDTPTAQIWRVPLDGSADPELVDGTDSTTLWHGPAVVSLETPAPTPSPSS